MIKKLMIGTTLLATTFVLQATPTLANSAFHEWGPRMMWGGGQWGGFGFFLGPVFWALVVVAIVAVIFRLLRGTNAPARAVPRDLAGDALTILNERFARGEIDEKEHQDRKRILTSH